VSSSGLFTFSLVNAAEGVALGAVVYPRRHFRAGELIAPGTLRVVHVIEPMHDGALPVLLVEPVETR
jgi:hypothetical protein